MVGFNLYWDNTLKHLYKKKGDEEYRNHRLFGRDRYQPEDLWYALLCVLIQAASLDELGKSRAPLLTSTRYDAVVERWPESRALVS